MIESLIKQGAQSTQHATFSKCSRARCEFVKPDFIHNIELKCVSDTQDWFKADLSIDYLTCVV